MTYPFSSIYLTINPISSIWEANITVGAFFSPFLVAITLPILSSSIESATSFNSLLIMFAIFSSDPETPGVKDSSFINSIISPLNKCIFYIIFVNALNPIVVVLYLVPAALITSWILDVR